MRKWIALVLAVLQIGFGGFLIANGSREDLEFDTRAERERRAEEARYEKEWLESEARMDEIVANGTEFLFYVDHFEYWAHRYVYPYDDAVIYISLDCDGGYYFDSRYYFPLAADENGMAEFGGGLEDPPAEPYFAAHGNSYSRIDRSALHALFDADLKGSDSHLYARSPFASEKIRFEVNGRWVPVLAVGYVYGGDVVFTGLVVDGVRYE